MSDGLDPDDYDITVGSLDHVPTSEEPDDIIDDVRITHERFASLRAHIAAEYDGNSAPNSQSGTSLDWNRTGTSSPSVGSVEALPSGKTSFSLSPSGTPTARRGTCQR